MKHLGRGAMGALALVALLGGGAGAQTLTVSRTNDAPHYDPHRTTAIGAAEPMYMMGDTLVALGWDLKSVHPLLAKSWTVSEDGKTYTFKLRDDVTFCSGKKMTAEDVVYSFKRAADPDTKNPNGWRVGSIKELRAPDPYTVEYELAEPFSQLLIQLTQFSATIVNKEAVERLGKDFGVKGFDGTGPYCWQSWEPRNEIVLTRHQAYKWGPPIYKNPGPAKFQRVVWKIVPEDATRFAGLMAGQHDVSYYLPNWAVAEAQKMPTVQVVEPEAMFRTFYFGFKTTREQVSDVRVRHALNLAVNRQELLDAIYFGQGDLATTYFSPKALDFDEKQRGFFGKFDPEAAKKLLDEAGWTVGPDGFRYKDGKKLRPLLYGYTVGNGPKLAEAVQGALRKIGVDMEIQLWDPTIYFSKLGTQDYDMWAIFGLHLTIADGLTFYMHSRNRPQPNRMNWADAETDRGIDAANAALTDADRIKQLAAVQQRVHEAHLWMPFVHERLYLAASKKIKNLRAHGNYGCALYKGLDVSL